MLLILIASVISANEYHVSVQGNDLNEGSILNQFRSINHAAQVAIAGDTVTVHAGIYRERIDPAHGGLSDIKRIIYRAATGEKVEIKGSAVITAWEKQKTGIWKVTIPNTFFGDYNPYKDSVEGDWFINNWRIHHTGEVFLNRKSLYEMETLDLVIHPIVNNNSKDPVGSTYTWYCETDQTNTTIWANFHQFNPNTELVEITVRPTVFYPSKPGINYITISGFHISQAATQWGAPTAEQVGMIATHWNKGWIIENNVISDSKCSGITLGKEKGTGHNTWTADKENVNRDGNIHYIEIIFNVLRNGWTKENIGSHIVRNNVIFNCEQTGICGSMGAVYSTIENNHIYNIWVKRLFDGYEIGGIKFHAPIDVQIKNNRINDCKRAIWLDWMTQGTRVSHNLFYNNLSEDLFVEVNHGPYLVDNNIMLSPTALRNWSGGGAFVHNLIAGTVSVRPELSRFTPYFLPHSINISGLTTIFGGDDRFYNNVFVGIKDSVFNCGLEGYNNAKLPVWISGNAYYMGAKPSEKDLNFTTDLTYNPKLQLTEEGKNVYLRISLDKFKFNQNIKMITTEILGKSKISKARYDNPDGTPLKIDMDFFGTKRSETNPTVGPFENIGNGDLKLKIW